ncbi:hypothetical protein V6N12_030470 [Hibiscus sabdariffa]|uniref:Uncharacterized protein n=1 Tax=Hibiscus sabdariffa TaxID=183260 RepID=A0ABR2C110_9ROSI
MDLETENRIAAILLKEAAELRRQAEQDGIHVYLQQPKVRSRPNSRFLTATVRGVQQANRAVEVNEMWRVRQKELELNDRLKAISKDDSAHNSSHVDSNLSYRSTNRRHESNVTASCSSSKRIAEGSYSREDGGLRDEEIDEFLQSRVKRGRGSIGSRMDETGPYLPANSESPEPREHRKKKEKDPLERSDKKHNRKHKSIEKGRDNRKEEKGSKHSK